MQSGRIAPLMRVFFGQKATEVKTAASAKDQSEGGQGQSYKPLDRDPTEEEVIEVEAFLNESDDFKKNTLTAKRKLVDGRWHLSVFRSDGFLVKTLMGFDILALLANQKATARAKSGRILDRRI